MCVGLCWPCVCVPCCVPSWRDVTHTCPNCNCLIGKYRGGQWWIFVDFNKAALLKQVHLFVYVECQCLFLISEHILIYVNVFTTFHFGPEIENQYLTFSKQSLVHLSVMSD